jgi:hypothetical protein
MASLISKESLLLKMVLSIRGNGRRERNREKDSLCFRMDLSMKENLRMMK